MDNAYDMGRKRGQEESRKEIKRLEQDIEDMKNSRQTIFKRCNKCGHLHDQNYQCFYCIEENNG